MGGKFILFNCVYYLYSSLTVCVSQQLKLMLPIGHTAAITDAKFSPDGKRIVTASNDKTAKIWDVVTGKILLDLKGHTQQISSVQYNDVGNRILTASWDSSAKIWDAENGTILIEIRGNKAHLRTAQFSSDGKKLLTVSVDDKVKIWNAVTGKLITEIKGNKKSFYFAQFSADGQTVVTNPADSTAEIWQVATGKFLREIIGRKGIIKGQTGFIVSSQFSADGKKMVSVSIDRTAKIWDVVSGNLIAELKGQKNNVVSAEFSPDGKKIVTASSDKTAGVWDAETGNLLADLTGHSDNVNAAHFSPDGKKIVTASSDKTARIWDASSGRLIAISAGHTSLTYAAQFSPDGKKIITQMEDRPNLIWDTGDGKLLTHLTEDTLPAYDVQFSPDCKKIATSTKAWIKTETEESEVRNVKIWDGETGKLITALEGSEFFGGRMLFSPDGKKIVTLSSDNMPHSNFNLVNIWDANTGKQLAILEGHFMDIRCVQFSPDGTRLLTGSLDISVKIWDVNSGKLLKDLTAFGGPIYSAQFSPDGKKIVTTAYRSGPRIWNAITGKPFVDLKGHTGEVTSARFSPDGKKIITVSDDKTSKIWDAFTGKLLETLKGHTGIVSNAQFSPDSKKILSSSYSDKIAKIWDAGTGTSLQNLKGHADIVNDANFSPDGKSIVTVSHDHTLKKWEPESGKLLYTFFGVDSVDYILQIPSGHYQCTPDASKLLHYVTKDLKVISFEQLDVKYNRPDLVLEVIRNPDTALINTYRNAYYKRIKKLGIDTSEFREGYNVPEADFVNRNDIPFEQKEETLTLHVKGQDNAYPLDRFNVWVNEVPVYGQRGISIRKNNFNNFDRIVTLKLSQGENRIETSVTNANGAESYRMPLIVNYAPVIQQKEKTYFIGIGLDKFSDSTYNLSYSSKDIRDLSAKLKLKYGNDISIDTLFNENVTASNIKTLKQKLLQTTVNDRVIISYSGHGLLSKSYDYYLSTYSVNFKNPEENGLPYDEFENLLDSIPARKKLMLIDACHSGEVDKEEFQQVKINKAALDANHIVSKGAEISNTDDGGTKKLGLKNSFELMQNLFVNVGKSTGATIISAAAGTEFALENGSLKNGVFTYCILEALDKYPTMKISELKKRVGARVEELTSGMQRPTSRNEAIAADWNVW